jgi:hypothetical protein
MTISELKLDLITKIINCNDIDLLTKIHHLLNENMYLKSDENLNNVNEPALKYEYLSKESLRVFSKEEQAKINLGLEQYEKGECVSDEEAQKEIQAWLED